MTAVRYSSTTRLGAAIGAAALIAVAAITPAQAHETPKPGGTCAMSGMVLVDHGKVQVCTSKTPTGKPRWSTATPTSASPLKVKDGWAKAAPTGMSAAFGMVSNPTTKPIRIVGATSPYSAVVQLHEVVDKDGSMVMQQKAGGFVIPAGGMLELKPGGNHLMFMDLKKAIKAGTMVPVTLITADGGTVTVKVLGKVYSGANETYTGTSGDMSGM
jgi:periplasmic copper chaperone A